MPAIYAQPEQIINHETNKQGEVSIFICSMTDTKI